MIQDGFGQFRFGQQAKTVNGDQLQAGLLKRRRWNFTKRKTPD